MRNKLVLVALAVASLMTFLATTASAGRLSASTRSIRATFTELRITAGEIADTCRVTLEGSFHSQTISKVIRTLLGFITRAETASCSIPTTILRANLPWHLTYEAFIGPLPNNVMYRFLTSVDFNIGTLGFNCLIGGQNVSFSANRNTATGALTSLSINSTGLIARGGGGFGCPSATGSLIGTGTIEVLGAVTAVTVRLI